MPLCAPLSTDDIIREVASAEGVELVDLAATFGPFPPGYMFMDKIHFTPQGAVVVALAHEKALRRILELPEAPGE